MASNGCLVHAVIPASASDDPISLKNPRRETASTSSDAPFGNSRCIISRKSALPANSSRLRQNSGPFFFSISERTCTRSSLSFLPGQTGSMCLFLFSSFINSVPFLRLRSGQAPSGLASISHFSASVSQPEPYDSSQKLTARSSQLSATSPMACRATSNIHRRTQVVLMRQILPQLHLVGIALPIHLNRQSGGRLL